MDIRIGKLNPDGTVRHIRLANSEREFIIPLLLNFYSRENRLDALLDLGNLADINCTPYGKWTGWNDIVHCCAEIRDNKEKRIRNEAQEEDSAKDFAKLKECKLLFVRGRWFILRDRYSEQLSLYSNLNARMSDPLKDINAYTASKEKQFNSVPMHNYHSWDDLRAYAVEKQETLFLFRKRKLIATIRPNC